MSHFATIRTQFTDVDALVKALGDVGFNKVEVHNSAQHLYGYQGDPRAQTAEVIIRREFVGRGSNDIGFKRQVDGTLQAIISEFDTGRYGRAWLAHLAQRYAYLVTKTELQQQGFSLVDEKTDGDRTIRLVLRRVV